MTAPGTRHELAWMIDRFAEETPGVIHAVLLAADGLPLAGTDGLDADQVDRTAAIAASLLGIATAMSREYGAGEPQILTFRTTELQFLFMTVEERAGLAVLVEWDGSLAVVGHEMARLVNAVGERLQPDLRPALPQPAATRWSRGRR